jgi:hypothetical protein
MQRFGRFSRHFDPSLTPSSSGVDCLSSEDRSGTLRRYKVQYGWRKPDNVVKIGAAKAEVDNSNPGCERTVANRLEFKPGRASRWASAAEKGRRRSAKHRNSHTSSERLKRRSLEPPEKKAESHRRRRLGTGGLKFQWDLSARRVWLHSTPMCCLGADAVTTQNEHDRSEPLPKYWMSSAGYTWSAPLWLSHGGMEDRRGSTM